MQSAILIFLKSQAETGVVSRFASLVPLVLRTKLEKNSATLAGLYFQFQGFGIGLDPKRVGFSNVVSDGV